MIKRGSIIKIKYFCILIFISMSGSSLPALDVTEIKIMPADQDTSIILNGKCKPVGVAEKVVTGVSGFNGFIPILKKADEPTFRKLAVEKNANTIQTLFELKVIRPDGTELIDHAYVRFWNCP